jgi:hypothetical protein
MPHYSLQFDDIGRPSLSRLRNSSSRCWRWDEGCADSAGRFCCSRSPTASQIDRLVLRSIGSLLSLPRLFMVGSASCQFQGGDAGPSHWDGNCFASLAECVHFQQRLNENCGRFGISEKAPARRRRGLFAVRIGRLQINSSGLPGASGGPTASEPICARSNRRNHNRVRRRRSAVRPSRSHGHASHRASRHRANRDRPRRKPRSAPMRPRPTKPRQLQRGRVCVTWSSP